MRVLAGDVGGTKTLFCIAERDGAATRVLRQQRLESADYSGFAELLRAFLAPSEQGAIAAACFAIAGPVRTTRTGQHVKVTNLPWEIDSSAIVREFGLPRLRMVNDFAGIGYALEDLDSRELVTLNEGDAEPQAPRAVIGAGTGLGQAILVWQRDHYEVIATEGSKADFGPVDELQLDLVRYLMQHNGRASYEQILSGSGLVRLYEFLRTRKTAAESPTLAEAMQQHDPAAAITQAALNGDDALARAALDLFVSIYGAQAGNLALTAGATGGVFVAGGIAPKIIEHLKKGAFVRAFVNKGKMTDYVRRIPVTVVMNTEVGLRGATAAAFRLAAADA